MKSNLGKVVVFIFMLSMVHAGRAFAAQAKAELVSTQEASKKLGEVQLEETADGLKISATFENLSPGKHGFHIHENGACADTGKAAGGHYNPDNVVHGNLSHDGFSKAHAGDFGNIEIGADGKGSFETTMKGLTLTGDKYNVSGRAFILHEKEDDFGQPTGNAGGRIGCGVIESVS